jgi:hypothetical protein
MNNIHIIICGVVTALIVIIYEIIERKVRSYQSKQKRRIRK